MTTKVNTYIQDHNANTLTSPPIYAYVVVPTGNTNILDLTADLGYEDADTTGSPCKTIWVGQAGHMEVILAGMTTPVIFRDVPIGWFDVRVRRVMIPTIGIADDHAAFMVACY